MSYGLDPKTQAIKILEENHYYPSGLKHESYNSDIKAYGKNVIENKVMLKQIAPTDGSTVAANVNQYKFNGMEYQTELGLNWYDMDMRDYDPAICRWTGIDPVTHFDQTPYMAFNGNPVTFADPSGADGITSTGAYTSAYGVSSYQGYNGYGAGSVSGIFWGDGILSPFSRSGNSFIINLNAVDDNADKTSWNATTGEVTTYKWHGASVTHDGHGFTLDTINMWYWEKVAGYGNSFNDFVGYASLTGEIVNRSWADATFKYGQRINGVVHSAEALTKANRATSLLWASRFAKVNFVSGIISTGVSYNNIYNSAQAGQQVRGLDIADATVGTIAAASSGASLTIAASLLNPASLGTAAFLVSNPVGWGIVAVSTAYFIGRAVYEYNKD
jgi:RHS repeat-associated protein